MLDNLVAKLRQCAHFETSACLNLMLSLQCLLRGIMCRMCCQILNARIHLPLEFLSLKKPPLLLCWRLPFLEEDYGVLFFVQSSHRNHILLILTMSTRQITTQTRLRTLRRSQMQDLLCLPLKNFPRLPRSKLLRYTLMILMIPINTHESTKCRLMEVYSGFHYLVIACQQILILMYYG